MTSINNPHNTDPRVEAIVESFQKRRETEYGDGPILVWPNGNTNWDGVDSWLRTVLATYRTDLIGEERERIAEALKKFVHPAEFTLNIDIHDLFKVIYPTPEGEAGSK